jgi:ATP-dependent DNA helicase RecG
LTCNGRLAEPEFDPRIDSFKVVLGRGGVEIAENRRWLTRTVAHDLDAHERAIAVMIRREGSATVADVRARLGIDSDEIRGAFQSLVDEGVLRRIGRDEVGLARTSRWSREEWRRNILGVLSPSEPMDIHDIAAALGRRHDNVRKYLKQLVDNGDVIATAPQSSTGRKYLLKS